MGPEARLDPDDTGVSRYELVVLAVDSGLPVRETASASVTVTIEDVNNKPPVFDTSDHAAYTRHVSERAQPGESVAQTPRRAGQIVDRECNAPQKCLECSCMFYLLHCLAISCRNALLLLLYPPVM